MSENGQSSPQEPRGDKAAATPAAPATPAATPAAPGSPSSASSAAKVPSGRRFYRAGGGRKLLFSLVFLLLLPFYASLPAMLYYRISAGLWHDTIGLAILAVCFTVVMVLVLFELIYSLRARLEIGDTGIRFSLPAARAGMPKLFYRRKEIPYSNMAAIETRREIYGGSLAPVLVHGTRIITQDGDKIALGYVNEANPDSLFPFAEIAREIANKAGVEIIHRGNVRRDLRRKWLGIKAVDGPESAISESEIETLNRRHGRALLILCGCLALLVAIGLAEDLLTTSLDTGERGAEFTKDKASTQAQKAKATAPQKKG